MITGYRSPSIKCIASVSRSFTTTKINPRQAVQTKFKSSRASWKRGAIHKVRDNTSSLSSTHFSSTVPHLVDYSIPPPIIPSPPAPPLQKGLRRWAFPATVLVTLFTCVYIYKNNKNDNYEFWDAMQSGKDLPLEVFEDDEDEDEDEDDEDDNDSWRAHLRTRCLPQQFWIFSLKLSINHTTFFNR